MKITRDHMDLGKLECTLGGVSGLAHHFHSRNPEHDQSRRCTDPIRVRRPSPGPTTISAPTAISSSVEGRGSEIHPVMRDLQIGDGPDPVPARASARRRGQFAAWRYGKQPWPAGDLEGQSAISARRFNIAASTPSSPENGGPAIAQSIFHHLSGLPTGTPAAGFPPLD